MPFRAVNGSYREMKCDFFNSGNNKFVIHDYHVGNCIWQEPTDCAVATQWSKNFQASMTLKVSNKITGWLHGRLDSPTISVAPLDKSNNLITVTGGPVTVEGSAPKVDVNAIPDDLMKVITRNRAEQLRNDSGFVWQMEPNSGNYDWFKAWLPQTHDKADGLTDYWNFKSIPSTNSNPGLASTSSRVGLVTSNSLWYSGEPPTFESGFLKYKSGRTSLHARRNHAFPRDL